MTGMVVPARVLIASQTLAADAATIDFSAIPPVYRSLYLVFLGRLSDALTATNVAMRFNGDSGTNYNYESQSASAAGSTAALTSAAASGFVGTVPAASTTAARVGSIDVLIPGYASAFHKAYIARNMDAIQRVNHSGGWWASTAVINQLTLIDTNGGNIVAGSSAALYGDL